MTVTDVLGRPIRDGKVLFHEHIQFGWPGALLDFKCRRTDLARAVTVLNELAMAGYSAVVDATPIECGRDLALLAAIAEQAPVQLVAATGMYHADRGFPDHLASLSVDEMEELYRFDVDGANPDGRAGVVKVAGERVPPAKREEKAARAAGRVAALGTPILTHTKTAAVARTQFQLMTGEGANPSSIVLGHLDNPANTIDAVADLAMRGAYVGIDRFGTGGALEDERRAGIVVELRDRGLLTSVLIAHDRPLTFLGRVSTGYESGNPFLHIERDVVPLFRDRGLSDSEIALLLEHNPQRWLRGTAANAA